MNFTPEQLAEKYETLTAYIEEFISSPRKEWLLALYEKYQDRILLAPASSKEHYHNAFPGGYLDHVCNVVAASLRLYGLYEEYGIRVNDFTHEEMVFSALNHDLGKIGDENGEYYIPNTSDWHRINQGKIYAFNPAIPHMNVTDRSFYLLQQAGIIISQNEYLGILLTDGLYEEKNKPYLMSYDKDWELRFNLPMLLHMADKMALTKERDLWLKEQSSPAVQLAKASPQTYPKKGKSDPQKRNADMKKTFENSPNASALFDSIFAGASQKTEN